MHESKPEGTPLGHHSKLLATQAPSIEDERWKMNYPLC